MDTLTHGSLFTGIGGMDLGFERAGIETVWQVEKDKWCTAVLEKNFPNVRQRYGDICDVDTKTLDMVGIISGGFPCQDISLNGKGGGLNGERSGLWWEFYRIVCDIRPLFVVVENVSALSHRGIDVILAALAEIGYDAEWQSIQGWWVDSPQRRERLFIVAYPASLGMERVWPEGFKVPHTLGQTILPLRNSNGEWEVEPDLRRTNDGFTDRVDRLTALGNCVIPQVAELVGYSILRAWHETQEKEMIWKIWNGYD